MSARHFPCGERRWPLALLLALSLSIPVAAQQPPPTPPNPQAPTLAMPAPLGMQRGTSMELALTGANLAGPTGFWTDIPGAKVTIPTDANNGKDNAKLRVRLELPKETPLGLYSIRLATNRGLSNVRLFCVDDLPQVMEVDTNRNRATPQVVPVPCVVVGRADAEVSDYFKVAVKAGQRLSFEILGRRLGSAFDPQITLYDARTMRDLPGGYSSDAPGLQDDARITYTFKEAGDYLVEVRDTKYSGGADFWYRLRIGDFPCANTPLPMAAKRGSKVAVNFAGPLVDGVLPVEVAVPADPAVASVWVTPRRADGVAGWPVELAISDIDEVAEQEPNNDPAKPNRIPVPGAISGRIQDKGDVDHFVFTGKKGQRFIIEAHSYTFHSPTEVFVTLKNAMGTQLAATNPGVDPRIDFTVPADGDYTLTVDHLFGLGGPGEAYRISVVPYEPGFDLAFGIDRYDVPQGVSAVVSVFAARRDYTGPIEVSVAGHPGITGQAVIPAGQPAAPNVPAALLFLNAKPDVPLGPYTLSVQGKATINGKLVVHEASVKAVISQNMGALPYPPRQLLQRVGVAVTDKPPFTLTAKFDAGEALRGLAAPVTITATRAAGFVDEIALTPLGLPANVAPALKNIPKGQNEVKVQLTPAAAAALGQFTISFVGKAKFQNVEFNVAAAPAILNVALPFDLQVTPAPLKLAQGAKAMITVTAVRKGGYQGPITLEVRNLPANVTAAKPTIAMGQAKADIEITAAATAAVGDKADVNVLGTATGAANQQNASANFVVSIAKK